MGEEDWLIREVKIGNANVEVEKSMKYLGVIIDDNLRFVEHVDYINNKAIKVVDKLFFVFKNKYGFGNRARKIMVEGCIHTLYKYAASIYYQCLGLKTVRSSIKKIQRRMNARVARAYKTVKFLPSCILANTPPIVYQIEKTAIEHQMKRRENGKFVNLRPPCEILNNRKRNDETP